MGADMSQCPLRVLQTGVDYFSRVDADPKEVVQLSSHSVANASSLFPSMKSRSGQRVVHIGLTSLSRSTLRRAIRPGVMFFKLGKQGSPRGLHRGRAGTTCCRCTIRIKFPGNSDAAQAKISRRKCAGAIALERRPGVSRPCGLAVCRPHRTTENGYRPNFLP